MDYVVFGIGFGATILVLGLLLRDFGPRLRFRSARDGAEVLSVEELVGKVGWTRFCTALGSVLAMAGAVFLLITLVAMILVVSDGTGLWIMSIAYAVLLVLMAYWTWAYFHRFGSYGILPERAEAEAGADASPYEDEEEEEDSYAGPPVPSADDDASVADGEPAADDIDEPVADNAEPMPEAEEIASEHVDDERDDVIREELDGVQEDGEGESEPAPSPWLETPEERLAHSESPIDHGSAEGDLDLAASGPRRRGSFTPRQPETTDESDVDNAESERAEDRDRA